MRENGKTSLHRWWKSWSKPNTFVRHLAVPSSNQPHNSLKHERQVKPNLFWSNLQKKGSHLLYTPPLLVWRKNMPGEASYKSGRHWGNCWQMPCPTQPVIKYSSPQNSKSQKIPTEYSYIKLDYRIQIESTNYIVTPKNKIYQNNLLD